MDGDDDRVGSHLFEIGFAELIQMRRSELEPPGKGIAADHVSPQGLRAESNSAALCMAA